MIPLPRLARAPFPAAAGSSAGGDWPSRGGSSARGPLGPSRRSVLLGAGMGTAALLSSSPEAIGDEGPDHHRSSARPLQFDFGPGRVTGGHHKVTATSAYSRKRGFGFASTDGLTETDRGGQDTVRADFVTAADATFLVDLSPGDYAVSVVAGDLEGATDLAITSNETIKVERTSAAPGEFIVTEYEIAVVGEQLTFDVSGEAPNLNAITIEALPGRDAGEQPTVYLLGDSTMQTYDPYWAPQAGWGQFYEQFLSDRVIVDNRSIGGRSSRSFLEEGRLDEVLRQMRPGDVVLIQFGHNDATVDVPERYTPPEDYREYLRTYVTGVRQRGGTAVVVTPVSLLDIDPDTGRFAVSFPDYVEAARAIAAEIDAPLVDLSASSRAHLDDIGADAARELFLHAAEGVYPNRPDGVRDDTHFQERGAIQMARLVARDHQALGVPTSSDVELRDSQDVPAPVDGVTVARATASTLELSWPGSPDADVYRVHVGEVDGGAPEFVGATSESGLTVFGLSESTEHIVHVSAVNEHGEGPAGTELRATTDEATHRFDFGPDDAPLADGYLRITPTTSYSEGLGHGLRDADGVISRDRGGEGPDAPSRSFIASFDQPYTFQVDLPDGEWSVVLTIGEPAGAARTTVALQGEERGDVAIDDGTRQIVESGTVSDGRLLVGISGATGHLNALTLTPAP